MSENNNLLNSETGCVNISSEVVSTVAYKSASGIDGVTGMNPTLSSGVAELFGKKNASKGVKVEIDGDDVQIDLFITVEYGAKIPDVAWNVQNKVKTEVEAMTGLNVTSVNVNIEGVNMPKENKVEEIEE